MMKLEVFLFVILVELWGHTQLLPTRSSWPIRAPPAVLCLELHFRFRWQTALHLCEGKTGINEHYQNVKCDCKHNRQTVRLQDSYIQGLSPEKYNSDMSRFSFRSNSKSCNIHCDQFSFKPGVLKLFPLVGQSWNLKEQFTPKLKIHIFL